MRHGRRATQRTLFNFFSSDYKGAGESFARAGELYGVGSLTKAREAWLLASEAYQKAQQPREAARVLESLGYLLSVAAEKGCGEGMMVSRDWPTARKSTPGALSTTEVHSYMTEAAKHYMQAGQMYEGIAVDRMGGAFSKAAAIMRKLAQYHGSEAVLAAERGDAAAAQLATCNREASKELYSQYMSQSLDALEASWDLEGLQKYKLPEHYQEYILESIRSGDLAKAVQLEKRKLGIRPVAGSNMENTYHESYNIYKTLRQPANAAKSGLEIIILCLTSDGDAAWARAELRTLETVDGFLNSEAANAARALVSAYEDRDPELLQNALAQYSGSCLNFLTIDIARMAKKLSIGKRAAKAAAPANASAELESVPALGVVVAGSSSQTDDAVPPGTASAPFAEASAGEVEEDLEDLR